MQNLKPTKFTHPFSREEFAEIYAKESTSGISLKAYEWNVLAELYHTTGEIDPFNLKLTVQNITNDYILYQYVGLAYTLKAQEIAYYLDKHIALHVTKDKADGSPVTKEEILEEFEQQYINLQTSTKNYNQGVEVYHGRLHHCQKHVDIIYDNIPVHWLNMLRDEYQAIIHEWFIDDITAQSNQGMIINLFKSDYKGLYRIDLETNVCYKETSLDDLMPGLEEHLANMFIKQEKKRKEAILN